MIRDFCGIAKGTLYAEINALLELAESGNLPKGVTDETVEAINHVRTVGNIGAHMEKDISIIVDVQPEEAGTLISLVEMLFDEWYVARQRRQERLAKISEIAAEKLAARSSTTIGSDAAS